MIVFSAELMDHIPLLTLIAVYTKNGFPDADPKKRRRRKKNLRIRKLAPANTVITVIMGNGG